VWKKNVIFPSNLIRLHWITSTLKHMLVLLNKGKIVQRRLQI